MITERVYFSTYKMKIYVKKFDDKYDLRLVLEIFPVPYIHEGFEFIFKEENLSVNYRSIEKAFKKICDEIESKGIMPDHPYYPSSLEWCFTLRAFDQFIKDYKNEFFKEIK